MRTLVVDASVAVKWLEPEDMSDVAKEPYGTGDRLVAPRLKIAGTDLARHVTLLSDWRPA